MSFIDRKMTEFKAIAFGLGKLFWELEGDRLGLAHEQEGYGLDGRLGVGWLISASVIDGVLTA